MCSTSVALQAKQMASQVQTASPVQRVTDGKATKFDDLRGGARTSTGSSIITLNVGGVKFRCKRELLYQCSRGRLGKIGQQGLDCESTNSSGYFFDRDPRFFPAVLDFYRCGRLQMNANFCLEQWEDELEFWELSDLGDRKVRPSDVSLRKRCVSLPMISEESSEVSEVCSELSGELPVACGECPAVLGESPLASGQFLVGSGVNIYQNSPSRPKQRKYLNQVTKVKLLFILVCVLLIVVLTFTK